MRIHPGIFIFFSVIFVGGCSFTKPVQKTPVTISYTMNREGKRQPCGCSMTPVGGVERQKKFLQQLSEKRKVLSVTGGNTFLPVKSKASAWDLEEATGLIQALNGLSLVALSPSVHDFQMGVTHILSLARKATFPFVTTNIEINGKTPFAPYVEVVEGGLRFRIFGLTKGGDQIAGMKVIAAPRALARHLKEKTKGVFNIVMAANFSRTETESLLDQFADIHLILRTRDSDQRVRQFIYDENSIWSEVWHQGQAVGSVHLEVNPEFRALYNSTFAAYVKGHRQHWQRELLSHDSTDLRKKLKQTEKNPTTRIPPNHAFPIRPHPPNRLKGSIDFWYQKVPGQ